jgi:hypothetical protein
MSDTGSPLPVMTDTGSPLPNDSDKGRGDLSSAKVQGLLSHYFSFSACRRCLL